MYSKEMFLKSEKISKKIKKCNYWWHFCLVYLVYLFQFCLVPLFVISVQSSDSSFVHKTGLIFLVGSFYIVSDQYSTDFNYIININVYPFLLCSRQTKMKEERKRRLNWLVSSSLLCFSSFFVTFVKWPSQPTI